MRPMKKTEMIMKTKPLRVRVRALTSKALKNLAAKLGSRALRVATVPQKPMVRFRPMRSRQPETQGDTSAKGEKADALKSPHCPHGLTPMTRTLKRRGNVSVARTPGFWTRTSACGVLA